jgi:vacuolar-type H+-ATPase subunit I/STV1
MNNFFFLQEDLSLSDEQYIFVRLMSMNSPEWLSLMIGSIASIFNGIGVLFFALIIAFTIGVRNLFISIVFSFINLFSSNSPIVNILNGVTKS